MSAAQLAFALAAAHTITSAKTSFAKMDYRELSGQSDKIASVGMFEHVGKKNIESYFRVIAQLLTPNGLFLNHAIARPEFDKDAPETYFLQKYVFPGGELIPLSDVIRAAENAGLEPLDIENLRPHYALTCKAWVENLRTNRSSALSHISQRTYRTWMLYLAASALSFEEGGTDLYQVLFARRNARREHMTRSYMYRPEAESRMSSR